MATHYERLGIDRAASPEEIKRAFRRMARQLHPDANRANPSASRQFGEAADAYRTLSDPALRAEYDADLNGNSARDGTPPSGHDEHSSGVAPSEGRDTSDTLYDLDLGDQGWGENRSGWEDQEPHDSRRWWDPSVDAAGGGDERASDPSVADHWADGPSADDGFEGWFDDRYGDRGRSDGIGWGEPVGPGAFEHPSPDYGVGTSPGDPASRRHAPSRAAAGHVHNAWGEPHPWERDADGFEPTVDAFAPRPDDVLLSRADRVTQLLCVVPVIWLAGVAMDSSLARVLGDLAAYRQASAHGDADTWERTEAWGDLVATTGRFALVVAVAVLAWQCAGRILRKQSVSLPKRRRWWRSPGWDGTARLIRVGLFVVATWLATAVLVMPTIADHVRAHVAAADVADAAHDRTEQLEDAYRSAQRSAETGRWRVVLWFGALPAAWVASAKAPARFGYYSRLDLL